MDASKGHDGFTLIELLIVLGILAILVAVVLPSVAAFLGRGQEEAFNVDVSTIQAAVSAYYTDKDIKVSGRFVFPTSAQESTRNTWGIFTSTSNTYALITFDWLVNAGYLRSVPQSASGFNSASTPGSYSWVIQGSTGTVFACLNPAVSGFATSSCTGGFGFAGVYP